MINLPNFKILDMKESEYNYRFLVESIALSPSHCSKCGTVANLYKHGQKKQLFFDLPMHVKRVGIYVNRRNDRIRTNNGQLSCELIPQKLDLESSIFWGILFSNKNLTNQGMNNVRSYR